MTEISKAVAERIAALHYNGSKEVQYAALMQALQQGIKHEDVAQAIIEVLPTELMEVIIQSEIC